MEIKVYAFIGTKKSPLDQAEYMSAKAFTDSLTAAQDTTDDSILIRTASGGGSVVDGNMMINACLDSTKPVDFLIDGYAASMGYFYTLGGRTVKAAANTLIMTHGVQGNASGSVEDIAAELEVLKKFNGTISGLLAKRTGLTEPEVIEKFMSKDTWFTAAEALAAGLIDGIEEYNAENIPDVTATTTHTEQMERFAASHRAPVAKASFIETIVAKVKAVMQKETPVAALVNSLDWSARQFYDDCIYAQNCEITAAKYAIANSSNGTVVAEAKIVLAESLAEMTALIHKVYGDGADVMAITNTIITAKDAAMVEKFTAAITEEITAQASEKDVTIKALRDKVATLELKPAAEATTIKKVGNEITTEQVPERVLSQPEKDREALLKLRTFEATIIQSRQ